jgi:hypothetical protein
MSNEHLIEDLKAARETVTAERIGYGFYLREVQSLLRAADGFVTAFSTDQQDTERE